MSFGDNPLSPPSQISPPTVQYPGPELPGPAAPPPEDPPWGLWDVVRIAVVAVIAIALASVVAAGIALRVAGPVRPSPAELARNARVVVPAQFAAYALVLLYMVALLRGRRQRFWNSVRWFWPHRVWIGWMALGVALAVLVQSFSALLPIPKSLPIDRYFRDTAGAYMMAAFGLTFAPLLEELFFRGFLYAALARRWGVATAVIVTSGLFAMIHESQLAHAWAPLLLLFFVGLVLTMVRAYWGSMANTFLIHVGYNATLFGLLFIASDHFRHFNKLS